MTMIGALIITTFIIITYNIIPVLTKLGIHPQYSSCSVGAVTAVGCGFCCAHNKLQP